jgi:hypothetical protein
MIQTPQPRAPSYNNDSYPPQSSAPPYEQENSYAYQSRSTGLTSSLSSGYYFCIISFVLCLIITIKMLIKNEWRSLIGLIFIWCMIGGVSTYFIYKLHSSKDYTIASFISCIVLCFSCIVSLKKTFNVAIF